MLHMCTSLSSSLMATYPNQSSTDGIKSSQDNISHRKSCLDLFVTFSSGPKATNKLQFCLTELYRGCRLRVCSKELVRKMCCLTMLKGKSVNSTHTLRGVVTSQLLQSLFHKGKKKAPLSLCLVGVICVGRPTSRTTCKNNKGHTGELSHKYSNRVKHMQLIVRAQNEDNECRVEAEAAPEIAE